MYDWKKIILSMDDTMKQAIEALNDEALRIVMVADKSNKLLGTITDGDIRRSMINKKSLSSLLVDVMHKNPKTISPGDTEAKAASIMKREGLLHLPIVDEKGVIIGLKSITNLNEVEKQRYSA